MGLPISLIMGIFLKNNEEGKMADKKSNLTSYDRKFIATIVFAHFGLVTMAISFFGLYY